MPETNDPTEAYDLQDLRADVIRRNHDGVDEDMSALEATIEDLEDEVADLKADLSEKDSRIDELTEEKQAAEQLLDQFQESQREAQLQRIRAANETVAPDDEVDLEADHVQEASVDTLAWMADRLEKAAEAAQAASGPRSGSRPDLSNAGQGSPAQPGSDDDARMRELASEMGMGDAYEKLTSGAFEAESPGVDIGGSGRGQPRGAGSVVQDGGVTPTEAQRADHNARQPGGDAE